MWTVQLLLQCSGEALADCVVLAVAFVTRTLRDPQLRQLCSDVVGRVLAASVGIEDRLRIDVSLEAIPETSEVAAPI